MNCPVCDARMREVEKHGVQVDICPDCKGVWLDRGELEKLLDMADAGGPPQSREDRGGDERRPEKDEHDERRSDKDEHDEKGSDRDRGSGGKRRRGSWLGDIMESFGGGGD